MKPVPNHDHLIRQPAHFAFKNELGYFARFKLTNRDIEMKKVRVLAILGARNHIDPKRIIYREMLDLAGLKAREITKLPLAKNETVSILRKGTTTFEVHLEEFFETSGAKIGDILEVHFATIVNQFGWVDLRIVDPEEHRTDLAIAQIEAETKANAKDPIWYMGAQLIENALRVTNPEDTKFYGSQSGSLSFWSYRSYNAREEIYIQWRWNSVGELYVEAVSNKYAWPKISNDGINHLLATGWSGPSEDSEDDLPNYFRTYEDVDVVKIAKELMAVFRDVYLVKRDWIWLFNPFHLVEELFKGQDDESFKFKDDAFYVGGQKHTFRRRCEMGVQLSEDILPPKWLRPWT